MFQCEYARETGSRTKATSVTFGYASWMRAAASGSQR